MTGIRVLLLKRGANCGRLFLYKSPFVCKGLGKIINCLSMIMCDSRWALWNYLACSDGFNECCKKARVTIYYYYARIHFILHTFEIMVRHLLSKLPRCCWRCRKGVSTGTRGGGRVSVLTERTRPVHSTSQDLIWCVCHVYLRILLILKLTDSRASFETRKSINIICAFKDEWAFKEQSLRHRCRITILD